MRCGTDSGLNYEAMGLLNTTSRRHALCSRALWPPAADAAGGGNSVRNKHEADLSEKPSTFMGKGSGMRTLRGSQLKGGHKPAIMLTPNMQKQFSHVFRKRRNSTKG